MEGHRAERMTQADDDDPKAANKHWSATPKPGPPKYNIPWTCSQREIGNLPRRRGTGGTPQELQWAAEDELILKKHDEFQCHLPTTSRSTFLMVFSPDGTKVASTHGDHNVYVSDLPSGKGIRKLSGHPRTPWCLAFHPSSNQILASGCLGGQVRVWDLHGGSELWTAESHTVIASLAFHPTDRMLVVATYNELHFWDWSQPVPFAKCFTASEKEKVRYVTFDPLGHKLITGIANRTFVQSQWDRIPVSMSGSSHSPSSSMHPATPLSHYASSLPSTSSVGSLSSSSPSTSSASIPTSSTSTPRPPTSSSPPSQGTSQGSTSSSSSASHPSEQENHVTLCFRSLMEQYEQLVQRYYDLSRAQVVAGSSRDSGRYVVPGTSGTANSASTTDRGTDPMEQDSASSAPGGSGQGPSPSQSRNTDNDNSLSGLDSLRSNIRRFRQLNFMHLPGCQQRGRSTVTRVTSQSNAEAGRGESRAEDGAPPVPSRDIMGRINPTARGGEFLLRMMHLPNTSRICRVRGMATSYAPPPSSTTTPPSSSNPETSTPSVPSSGLRQFASVRSAFRPRLSSLRPAEQAALDLRVRASHATTETTNSTSTFSTSLRSAFQPRTSTSRSSSGVALRGNSSGRQGSRFSLPPADVSVRFGIQLLSRHIDNMQRLCRARLEILQLQQIRRMWEDLQRQIGSLHAAVRDGSSAPGPPPSPAASTSSPHLSPSPPHTPPPPSNSPPPRPSRPNLLPPSPPPIPPPPLSSPSSGEDEGVEPSPDQRAEDEEDGLRVRELMELARISGGEEPDGPSVGGTADGPSEASGDAGGGGGVSSGATASPFRDRPGNQTSRKRARVPSRFPEPGPSRRLRLVARMSTGSRPTNRGRLTQYPSTMLGFIQLRPQRRQELRHTRCGPPYLYLQRLPEEVISAARGFRQPRVGQVPRSSGQPEAEGTNESVAESEGSNVSQEQNAEEGPSVSIQGEQNLEESADENRVGEAAPAVSDAQPAVEDSGNANPTPAAAPATSEPSSSSGPTASQINSFRQAGEDFHGRFCSMISRLEVLVRQQRENRESYWRARGDALWTRREAGRPEGGGSGSSNSGRGSSDGPAFTLSDSSSDESDGSNLASPLARRMQLMKRRHLRACQRIGWSRGMGDGEGRPPFPPRSAPSEPSSSAAPPSTSSQVPTASTSSNVRDEPSTSSGAPSDAEWQWTRESTRLRARQVLSMMVESLTQFFEQHGLSHETPHAILDEQIYNLYVLLQLALELTDLLLIQLMSTRRELEEQWLSSLRGTNSEGNNSQDSAPGRRSGPPPTVPSSSASNPHGQRLIRAITRTIFPSNWGDGEGAQRPTEGRDSGSSAQAEASSRPRQFFTVPEVQVNDVPVAPEAVSLLGEPPGGRPRARSPPPPMNIFVPVGGPRNIPTMSSSSVPSSRRGRPNPFVQLHQLRRLGAATGGIAGSGNGGNGTGGGVGGAGGGEGRFRRFLHPRYVGPNPLGDDYREDPLQETVENILRDATMAVTHRIQAWDFSSCTIPEIGDGEQNVVVPECKIHNDASVDVSSDGRMLVALLPPGRLQINTMLGIYSLEWGSLGDCLFIMSLAQNAVSVSLSPTCRHLAVGLASRRVALLPSDRHTLAQLYRLESAPPYPSPPPSSSSSKGKGGGKGLRRGGNNNSGSTPNSSQVIGHLHHMRDIEQSRGQGYASLNCIRWMPVAGQGLVFGTNTGHLKILR